MNACEIIEVVLGLEMKVHYSLLTVHKCASGLYGDIKFPEDPHVNLFKLVFVWLRKLIFYF